MKKDGRRNGTRTSDFGSPGRFGHDSTKFYASRLYEGLPQGQRVPYHENPVPANVVNHIFCKSSERMEELPDCSIHLMVTSPPYNVGKLYDEDLTLGDYRGLLRRVMAQVYRVLVPGGRVCFNIANLGRKPYLPLHAFIVQDMLELQFLMRGEIIWDKAGRASPSTAWGTWQSPANPTLRDIHEYIMIFSKETYTRPRASGRQPTISRDEFLELTKSVWRFPPEPARKIGHPAPFPVELPYRCIQLYTYANEVVLDPFMGSGSTALAALKTSRYYVGYEIDPGYVRLAEQRIKQRCMGSFAPQLHLPSGPESRSLTASNSVATELE